MLIIKGRQTVYPADQMPRRQPNSSDLKLVAKLQPTALVGGGKYAESEQVCEFYDAVPSGITLFKQFCFCKPDKNEYNFSESALTL